MKNKYKLFNLLLITIALVGFSSIEASLYQDAENSNDNSSQEESNGESEKKAKGMPGKKKEYKTIDEFIEDGEFVSMEGFMNILHETEKDKYYLVLDEDQLNKEFIYFTYVLNGPSDAGPSGGDMGEAFILSLIHI